MIIALYVALYVLGGVATSYLILRWSTNISGKLTVLDLIVGGLFVSIVWPTVLPIWLLIRTSDIVLYQRKGGKS